jgi:hypothetical protein
MLDATSLIETEKAEEAAAVPTCLKCGQGFERKRKDQTYCSRRCAKAASRHTSRGPRTVTESPTERRRQEDRTGRIKGLSHALYETPPRYRAEFLERLIAEARGNVELRRLITQREFLSAWWRLESTGRLHKRITSALACAALGKEGGERPFATVKVKVR